MTRQAIKRTPAKADQDQDSTPTSEAQKKDFDFISRVVKDMEEKCGKGTAMVPDASTILCKIDHWVGTRNFMIDSAIAGGLPLPRPIIPFGRVTEIAGQNGAGKTTLLGQIAAEVQRTGGVAAIGDTEQALDLSYMERLGVDLRRLIIFQADHIEEYFARAEALINAVRKQDSDRLVLLGWDSLGGTPTQAQAEAEADDKFYAAAAKAVGQNLQRVVQMISKQRIAFVINNHIYRRLDVKYGDPWQSYGGEKVQYFSTLRLRLTRSSAIKEGDGAADDETKQTIGHWVKVQVVKNKMAPILRTVEVPCLGGEGFSLDYTVFEEAVSQKLITGSKGWKTWETPSGEEVKFQGWNGFKEKVAQHAEYPELVGQVVRAYHQKATT